MGYENINEFLIEKGLLITAFFSIIIIFTILIFIFTEAIPVFQEYGFLNFMFGMDWKPTKGDFGVFEMIIGSIYVTFLALIMAVPLSLLCAIFMEEVAPNKVKVFLKPVIQTLAGIPSVVYGFFGLTVLVPLIREYFGGTGFSIFTASLILAVMILPTIISVSQDAIKFVPHEYKEASYGLGSTNLQTIHHIILPTALPGIVTAIILGIGRAIGETLAVLMVVGNVVQIPGSIFDSARPLTTNIALEMGYATGLHYNALFGTAVVLFIIIIILLIIANYIQSKYGMEVGGGTL